MPLLCISHPVFSSHSFVFVKLVTIKCLWGSVEACSPMMVLPLPLLPRVAGEVFVFIGSLSVPFLPRILMDRVCITLVLDFTLLPST